MATHVEWLDATHASFAVEVRAEGAPWDGDEGEAIPSEVGLVLADDDAVVVCGTPTDLLRILTRALNELAAHNAKTKKEK